MNAKELIERYKAGERDFSGVNLSGIDFDELNPSYDNFTYLSGANLSEADLSKALYNPETIFPPNTDLSEAYCICPGSNLRNSDFQYVNLDDADLRGADLTDANFNAANLKRANLSNTNFKNANLSYANVIKSNLREANFNRVNLGRTVIEKCDCTGAIFTAVPDFQTSLYDNDFTNADFSQSSLDSSHFQGSTLDNTKWEKANLINASIFGNKQYSNLDVKRAVLTTGRLIYFIRMSVDVTDTLYVSDEEFYDSEGNQPSGLIRLHDDADLSGLDLNGCNFSRLDLANMNFSGTNLRGAIFICTQLKNPNFTNADLRDADLEDAEFDNPNFTNANLKDADIKNAHLDNAIFCNTIMPDGGIRNYNC